VTKSVAPVNGREIDVYAAALALSASARSNYRPASIAPGVFARAHTVGQSVQSVRLILLILTPPILNFERCLTGCSPGSDRVFPKSRNSVINYLKLSL
jgi:hypothetical protein